MNKNENENKVGLGSQRSEFEHHYNREKVESTYIYSWFVILRMLRSWDINWWEV